MPKIAGKIRIHLTGSSSHVVLAGACLVASTTFAAAEDGSESFAFTSYVENRCTFCHSRALTVVFLERVLEASGTTGLDAFLSNHHCPSPEERASIIRYLERESE